MDDSVAIEYYSETFARMSVAYAAAHAEEPTVPGPKYTGDIVYEHPLTSEEEAVLQLSQDDFKAYIREKTAEIIKAEAEERYVPEETDGVNPYSAINFGSVWRMVEMDSIDFYRNGEAIGETRIVPIVNGEDAILSEDGRRSLNQDAMNELVAERLATPAGGYERIFKMDKSLNHLIVAYVKVHPDGPKEEHYRELIYGVRMAAAEAAAEEACVKRNADIAERMNMMAEEEAAEEEQKKRDKDVAELHRLRELQSKAPASESALIEERITSLLNRLLG